MNVFIANEQEVPVDEQRLSELARHTLTAENVDASVELSLLLVSREHIQQLNARFAGNDHPTDVLAFPMMQEDDDEDDDDAGMLGDVVICPIVAEENANREGRPTVEEVEDLLVHGTLHLLGYDHQTDAQRERMESRTKTLVGTFRRANN